MIEEKCYCDFKGWKLFVVKTVEKSWLEIEILWEEERNSRETAETRLQEWLRSVSAGRHDGFKYFRSVRGNGAIAGGCGDDHRKGEWRVRSSPDPFVFSFKKLLTSGHRFTRLESRWWSNVEHLVPRSTCRSDKWMQDQKYNLHALGFLSNQFFSVAVFGRQIRNFEFKVISIENDKLTEQWPSAIPSFEFRRVYNSSRDQMIHKC